MKVDVERLPSNKAVLEVEVEEERLDQALHQAYRKVVRQVNIPGFRRGKAPRKIVERFVGKGVLLEEALDSLLPEAYLQALKETRLDPIDQPEVEILHLEEGEPLRFKATVEVKPEVTLGQYKELGIERKPVKVTDEEIDSEIEALRERNSELVSLGEDVPAEEGHYVIIDYEGTVEGDPNPVDQAEGFPLLLGSGLFLKGFDEKLVGAKAGEEREIEITYPPDYPNEELAGKQAKFHVKVKEVKKRELPELNDDFARQVSEFDTLQELRNHISNKLKEVFEVRARREYEEKVIAAVVENAKVDIPKTLVDRRINRMIERMRANFEDQSLSLEDYLKSQGKDLEALREELRPNAEKSVKKDLVLEAVAAKEGIEASTEEVNTELERLAQLYDQPLEKVRELFTTRGALDNIREDIRLRKTVEFLVKGAQNDSDGDARSEDPDAENAVQEDNSAVTSKPSGDE